MPFEKTLLLNEKRLGKFTKILKKSANAQLRQAAITLKAAVVSYISNQANPATATAGSTSTTTAASTSRTPAATSAAKRPQPDRCGIKGQPCWSYILASVRHSVYVPCCSCASLHRVSECTSLCRTATSHLLSPADPLRFSLATVPRRLQSGPILKLLQQSLCPPMERRLLQVGDHRPAVEQDSRDLQVPRPSPQRVGGTVAMGLPPCGEGQMTVWARALRLDRHDARPTTVHHRKRKSL